MPIPVSLFRIGMNLWSPFRSPGIRVRDIRDDWHYVRVELKLGLTNRNFVGTQFGGSLYAMADPFYMLMLMHVLGRDYLVWDQSARIEYVKPGKGKVYAEFTLTPERVAAIRADAAGGDKVMPEFQVEVRDAGDDSVVARIERRLYVRLKRERRPATVG